MTTKQTSNSGASRKPLPRAYEDGRYLWSLHRVPRKIQYHGKFVEHPGRRSAIFVVHGIGDQLWTQTAAMLRSGFEDTFEEITSWQAAHPPAGGTTTQVSADELPPPFIYDGYWCNYSELDQTFPEDWARFTERERKFFSNLWQQRSSVLRTYFWFLRQQLRLLHPRLIKKVGWYYVLYWPLQLISLVAITIGLLRSPKIITRFIADVRLYVNPKGIIEHAVVQRIDYRVGAQFLRLIGLDWEFRRLEEKDTINASGEHVTFERVVWVAHSLGTVISYNVLSDLFHRANELTSSGDAEQQEGVTRFRNALRRFITLGSPLDKIAFLFCDALRPWPDQPRDTLLYGGEELQLEEPSKFEELAQENSGQKNEWWVNFYSVFDPVSGGLGEPLICGGNPPPSLLSTFHLSSLIPGLAHVQYWSDSKRTQRYILGRTYGYAFLRDKPVQPYPKLLRIIMSIGGYFFWFALILGLTYAIIHWAPELKQFVIESLQGVFKPAK